MTWRLRSKDYDLQKGEGNRQAMIQLVTSATGSPGILAYADGQAVGWCAIAPREEYIRLNNSRILRPVDDQPVWSLTCFFIHKNWRGKGLSVALIKEAIAFAGRHGAKIVEGYPVEPRKDRMPEVFAFTGLAKAFTRAGFEEVARHSEGRPIMRYHILNT